MHACIRARNERVYDVPPPPHAIHVRQEIPRVGRPCILNLLQRSGFTRTGKGEKCALSE